MKVLLDIREDKAAFIMELLQNFEFVKAEQLTPHEAEVLEELEDIRLYDEAKKGKQEFIVAEEAFREIEKKREQKQE